MTNEMIERVARAIAESERGEPLSDHIWDSFRDTGVLRFRFMQARAAIAAMREPTEAMMRAGDNNASETSAALFVWPAMIDAALSEPPVTAQEMASGFIGRVVHKDGSIAPIAAEDFYAALSEPEAGKE